MAMKGGHMSPMERSGDRGQGIYNISMIQRDDHDRQERVQDQLESEFSSQRDSRLPKSSRKLQ